MRDTPGLIPLFLRSYSTTLLVFQPGAVRFDEDLVTNSRSPIETLVRVGVRIGQAAGVPGQFK